MGKAAASAADTNGKSRREQSDEQHIHLQRLSARSLEGCALHPRLRYGCGLSGAMERQYESAYGEDLCLQASAHRRDDGISDSFLEAVEHENRLGLLCTTVNQTINDLLRADGDNQVIQESLATVYYTNGESFDSLRIDDDLISAFEHYKNWAIEYYDEA